MGKQHRHSAHAARPNIVLLYYTHANTPYFQSIGKWTPVCPLSPHEWILAARPHLTFPDAFGDRKIGGAPTSRFPWQKIISPRRTTAPILVEAYFERDDRGGRANGSSCE
jgi:hypothetical protein